MAKTNDQPLTDRQIDARKRLRARSMALIEQAELASAVEASLDEAAVDTDMEGSADNVERAQGDVVAGASEVVLDTSPEGPPWNYDLTPEERAKRAMKKEARQKRTETIKRSALNKTPKKLKNASDLQIRFRTALVYTLVTIAAIFLGNIALLIYLMIVAGICAGEFYYMLRSDAKLPNEALGITGAVLYLPAVYFWGLNGGLVVSVVLLIALLVWYVFWLKARVPDVGVSFFGAAYTGLLLCGLIVIRQSVDGIWGSVLIFLIFLSVWANDAFAYFIGSKFGKHKLAPRTSPKKSWEGFIAGLVGSALVWVVMSFIPAINMSITLAIVFGVLCGMAEVIGDLAESRIKRNSGFKDSGTIMPGHGGLLDRCDSLFLASVCSCVFLLIGGCIGYM